MGPVFGFYKGLVVIVWWGAGLIIEVKLTIFDCESLLLWYFGDSWGFKVIF